MEMLFAFFFWEGGNRIHLALIAPRHSTSNGREMRLPNKKTTHFKTFYFSRGESREPDRCSICTLNWYTGSYFNKAWHILSKLMELYKITYSLKTICILQPAACYCGVLYVAVLKIKIFWLNLNVTVQTTFVRRNQESIIWWNTAFGHIRITVLHI